MDKQEINKLYGDIERKIMRTADLALNRNNDRLQEIINYARHAGIKRIGIAYCKALTQEALAAEKILNDEFEIFSVHCKKGEITCREMTGLDVTGISCNPSGQAEFLKEKNTELNISIGLCVGHDMIFNMRSVVPVTTFIVKDRKYNHNPIKGLNYSAENNESNNSDR